MSGEKTVIDHLPPAPLSNTVRVECGRCVRTFLRQEKSATLWFVGKDGWRVVVGRQQTPSMETKPRELCALCIGEIIAEALGANAYVGAGSLGIAVTGNDLRLMARCLDDKTEEVPEEEG